MRSVLDRSVQELGEGRVVLLDSGETVFKLDSIEDNPIVKPQDLGLTWHEKGELKIGAVFNAGAEVFQDKVMLMPRCHQGYRKGTFFDERLGIERTCLENYISEVWPLVSEDGVHFTRFRNLVIRGDGADHQDFTYGIEDIRIVKYGQRNLLIGCGKINLPFKGENSDRNAIKRRSQNLLLEAGRYPHEKEKVGPSTQVIKTDRGWLLIYHAVGEIDVDICKAYGLAQKIQRGYSVCAALLDLDDARKVLCRTRYPIYIPSAPYELHGNDQYPVDVPAVVFPVGAFVREGKLILYAGAGDKYVILLSCGLDRLINYLWEYCKYIA